MYSVFRFHLFNAKVIVTELLTSLLWVFTFLRTLLASDPREQVLNGGLFALALVLGWLLIKSVQSEVRARERIEAQEKELEVVNRQQETLLHFISHEIKGYLTESEAGFAAIVEGDAGVVSPQVKHIASAALATVRKGVATVMQILSASNLKNGTVIYAKKPFDFKAAMLAAIDEFKPAAAEKHLTLEAHIAWEANYTFTGDENKIRQDVIRNLFDNAIKYSPSGTVRVELMRTDGKIRFAVKDNGVGITPEDMARLFTEGGHGKDSLKVNAHSTGYGLFIAKTIVEAHGGKIWAESDGAGKGSRFVIELPASS